MKLSSKTSSSGSNEHPSWVPEVVDTPEQGQEQERVRATECERNAHAPVTQTGRCRTAQRHSEMRSAGHELMRQLASRARRLFRDKTQVWFTQCQMSWTQSKAARTPSPKYVLTCTPGTKEGEDPVTKAYKRNRINKISKQASSILLFFTESTTTNILQGFCQHQAHPFSPLNRGIIFILLSPFSLALVEGSSLKIFVGRDFKGLCCVYSLAITRDLQEFNPLKWIGLATDQVLILSDLCHCQTVPGCFGSAKDPRHLIVSEPYLGLSLSSRRVREVNRRMSSRPGLGPGMHHTYGSGVIFYEYEKRKKFEDYDMEVDAELGSFKIRRYHFDDESFVHPLYSVRFDPDRPYEIPIEALMADKILSSSKDEKSSTGRSRSFRRPTPHYSPRRMPAAQHERSTSSVKGTSSFCCGATSSSLRKPRSWELISPSEGWMCDADDKKDIGGMEPSIKNEESSEEDPEEEEEPEEEDNPEDGIPATPSLPIDIDAKEDYQRYIEELGRAPEPSPLRSDQASVPDEPVEEADRQSVSHDGSSYNLSGVWQ
ncbi:hypothetical protein PIB30_026281 [Stylosanthes scabra]|uniref:Uncharacterized protein n=1 Tax=Stylosanthes scabra TaxID=79078 RepID=A0ABU6TC99_9FABA|nr:hypothetical protein [Stylosanthes scabra]